jgi:hypothetical protein
MGGKVIRTNSCHRAMRCSSAGEYSLVRATVREIAGYCMQLVAAFPAKVCMNE